MADPVIGQPLQVGDMLTGGWQAQTNDAFEKCRRYLPATWPVKVDPAELAKEKAFDDCMRKHGIAVPTPDANGMIAYSTDPYAQDAAEVEAAVAACRHPLRRPGEQPVTRVRRVTGPGGSRRGVWDEHRAFGHVSPA